MALPSVYSETTLAQFMLDVLGPVAVALEWTELTNVQEIVNDTLLAYGVSDISDATDIAKLRAVTRVQVWRAVVEVTAGNYAVSLDGQSLSRNQVQAQAVVALKQAMAAAEAAGYLTSDALGSGWYVGVDRLVLVGHDPYAPVDDDVRTLP